MRTRQTLEGDTFSNRQLFRLILPLIAEQFLAVLVGMADTLMVSGVGESAVAAISTVDTVNLLLIQLFTAFSAGGSIVAAQYLGKQDLDNAGKAAKQLLISVFGISLLLAAVSIVFHRQIVGLMDNGSDPLTVAHSYTYLTITAISFPALALYNGGISLLRAMGNTRTSMWTSIVMNVINIGGNALLIHPCGLGVAGAAIATLTARTVSAVIVMAVLFRPTLPVHLDPVRNIREYFRLDFGMIRRILKIGIPGGVENSLFQVGKVLIMGVIASFATPLRAANGICNSLCSIVIIPAGAVGLASNAIIGQLIGADKKQEAMRYGKRLMKIMYLVNLPVNLPMFFFAETFVGWFNLSAEAVPIACLISRVYCVVALIIEPSAFSLSGILRAAGDARYPMRVSIISMLILRIACCYLFVYVFNWSLMGVWIAMYCDWVVRASFFIHRFRSGKWLDMKVV